MTCKGICDRHKASKPSGISRYVAGQKRCNICDIYLEYDGFFCPCCNLKLRTSSRNAKHKEKYRILSRI